MVLDNLERTLWLVPLHLYPTHILFGVKVLR